MINRDAIDDEWRACERRQWGGGIANANAPKANEKWILFLFWFRRRQRANANALASIGDDATTRDRARVTLSNGDLDNARRVGASAGDFHRTRAR